MSDLRRTPLSVILNGGGRGAFLIPHALSPRDGADPDDGTAARVAKLEGSFEHFGRETGELRTDMREVRDRLQRMEGDVDRLPGRGFGLLCVILLLLGVAALIAYQTEVQRFAREGVAFTQALIAGPPSPASAPTSPGQ